MLDRIVSLSLHQHPGPLVWDERGPGSALPELQRQGCPLGFRSSRGLFSTRATHGTWGIPGSLRMSELEGSQDAQPIPVTNPEGLMTFPKSVS